MGVTSHWNNNTLEYAYGVDEPIGTWYNFLITTSSSGTQIYLDGELKAYNSNFIDNTYVSGTDLAIGVAVNSYGAAPYTDGNIGYFNGIIDNVRIYDRALSPSEIQELYAYESTPTPVPGAFLLGMLGLSVAGIKLRKHS